MVTAILGRGNGLLKRSNSDRRVPFLAVISILILLFTVMYLIFGSNTEKVGGKSEMKKQKWHSFNSVVKLDPTVEYRNGTHLIWQIPESPKAVLFLAHGCNGKASNFWDKSPKCPDCVGLPEERLITLHALARNFAVLAVSSAGRCWSFGEERVDVKDIIQRWIAKQRLVKLPLVALGASSGGYFVSVLATDIRFSSITLMIAEGMFGKIDIPSSYPPTLFVHMPKDDARKQKIDKYMRVMKQKGISVGEIKCTEFPITPSYLADRIPGIDSAMSIELFNLFMDKGFIDKNGYMMNDGRAIHWKGAVQERSSINLPDKSLLNHIQEEMNLAFAYHEMTSLQAAQIFEWFEYHLS